MHSFYERKIYKEDVFTTYIHTYINATLNNLYKVKYQFFLFLGFSFILSLTGCYSNFDIKDLREPSSSNSGSQNVPTDNPPTFFPPQAIESSSGVVTLEGSKGFKIIASVGSPTLATSQTGTKGFQLSSALNGGNQ